MTRKLTATHAVAILPLNLSLFAMKKDASTDFLLLQYLKSALGLELFLL